MCSCLLGTISCLLVYDRIQPCTLLQRMRFYTCFFLPNPKFNDSLSRAGQATFLFGCHGHRRLGVVDHDWHIRLPPSFKSSSKSKETTKSMNKPVTTIPAISFFFFFFLPCCLEVLLKTRKSSCAWQLSKLNFAKLSFSTFRNISLPLMQQTSTGEQTLSIFSLKKKKEKKKKKENFELKTDL